VNALRQVLWPRLGTLRQHAPQPLFVPFGYAPEEPPDPAPTISIVTPSHQQGRFLERTLRSVLNQRYPALEYVVQDGGSSDETIDVLRRFEPFLTAWSSEPDGGQAEAINRGFARTSGEIMAWLNSDDLLVPGTLAYVARCFVTHPDVDVLYGHRLLVDEQDRKIGSWIMPRHSDRVLTLADYVPQETLFWRRRVWDAAGGRVDPDFRYAIDWDLLLRFRHVGARILRVPRFLGGFRVHDEQKSLLDSDIGAAECRLLQSRERGKVVSGNELRARLLPYLARHVVLDDSYRIADRLRTLLGTAQTTPLEAWLQSGEYEVVSGPS
jgi:glycosyltransferase involved in cell wall biosynthesis